MSRKMQPRGLMALPSEVLVMVLARLPLRDLANVSQVCRRLHQLIEGPGGKRLWATVSLEGLAVDTQHQSIIERVAGCGNREALIKLAMAFLYNQGVPKGSGAGTLDSQNGMRAAELMFELDRLSLDTRPLSWLLIRPPWSSSVSNKVCAYHKMIERCLNTQTEAVPGLFYSLGQTVNFLQVDGKEPEVGQTSLDWFERGASHGCSFSALQVWRKTHKHNLATRETQALRSLRKIVSMSSHDSSSLDAKLELCVAYAGGHYGSLGRDGALTVIRELMTAAPPVLSRKIFRVQRDITNIMRHITVDWMVEIAELKSLSPHTLHLAVALFDGYLLARQVDRSALQLLGVTAILVASRWSGTTMLTIRESSWLTENTYSYEEVVRMMAELLGAFQGDIRRVTVCDYLDILLRLCGASASVQSMAYYLSECVLLHPEFGRFSSSHLAAACLLDAQILLKQDYPWPVDMEQATGFTLSALRKCCVMIYRRCLTKEYSVADHRGVELCAISSRYSHPTHQCVSKHKMMSLNELSEQLGISSESPDLLTTPKPKSKVKDKLLSFLSDSCYLSSPLWLSGSESESESELDCDDSKDSSCTGSGFASLKSTSSSISFHSLPGSASSLPSPHSSEQASLRQRHCLPSLSPSSSLLPSSSHSHPHPSLHPHLSLSTQQLQHASTTTTTTNLSHRQSLSAPLVPTADFFTTESAKNTSSLSQQLQISPPHSHLARYSSLNSCVLQCSLGLTEKTGRAHVSCPDFHSCSTDMELGSASQDESTGMETCDSSSSESHNELNTGFYSEGITCPRGYPTGGLNFQLPPLGEQQLPNLRPISLPHLPKNGPSMIWNHLPPISAALREANISGTGGNPLPMGGHLNRSQSSLPLSKKSRSVSRTPLQSLHNTPDILNSRQSSVGTGKEGKQVSSPSTLHFTQNSKRS